jgi:hypothetical protein
MLLTLRLIHRWQIEIGGCGFNAGAEQVEKALLHLRAAEVLGDDLPVGEGEKQTAWSRAGYDQGFATAAPIFVQDISTTSENHLGRG